MGDSLRVGLTENEAYEASNGFSPATAYQLQLGKELRRKKHIARNEWDFAVDGGDIGSITLRGDKIPNNAIIQNAWFEVLTTLTSATDAATGALSVESANDLFSALAISAGANAFDAGLHQGVPDYAAVADWVKTTADRFPAFAIAVEAVTAGKLALYTEYVLADE